MLRVIIEKRRLTPEGSYYGKEYVTFDCEGQAVVDYLKTLEKTDSYASASIIGVEILGEPPR